MNKSSYKLENVVWNMQPNEYTFGPRTLWKRCEQWENQVYVKGDRSGIKSVSIGRVEKRQVGSRPEREST